MDEVGEKQKETKIEIFKYNAILSALFFIASTLYLGGQVPGYSFSKYTISQMSHFLKPEQMAFFNLIFIIKSILDLSFTYYVFKVFHLKLNAATSLIWLIAVMSFGLIGFFPVNQYFVIHWILAVSLFVFWTISEYVFASITRNDSFILFTNNIILLQAATVFLFFSINKINGVFEMVYFLFAFLWQIVFISRFLK